MTIDETCIEYIEAGLNHCKTIVFIHGWPTNYLEFDKVTEILKKEFHIISLNIPGIGEEATKLSNYSKKYLGALINKFLECLNLTDVCVVGTDVGGQIVYSMVKNYIERLGQAIIMNVAIPGVPPWNKVISNPWVWHFSFHSISELPEKMVSGKEQTYLEFFYQALTTRPLEAEYKEAFVKTYQNPISLKSGFELYRYFSDDAKQNKQDKQININIPVLYIRGAKDSNNMTDYKQGFIENNFKNIKFDTIADSKHFSSLENPGGVAEVIKEFIKN
ncbi:alpha/beta fold hydrolase [Staphylococcus simulans]